MKKLTVFFIAVSLIISFGCSPRVRTPQIHTYRDAVPPDNMEGKQCCLACKQIQLQCEQLALSGKYQDLMEIEKDLCRAQYFDCVVECGGTIETKTTTY